MCLWWLLLFKHEIRLIVYHPEEKRVFLMIRPQNGEFYVCVWKQTVQFTFCQLCIVFLNSLKKQAVRRVNSHHQTLYYQSYFPRVERMEAATHQLLSS